MLIPRLAQISLQLEKTVIPPSRSGPEDSDDSSDEESEVKFENISGAARQAQFTVRLLIDFLPNDILENFRYVDIYNELNHAGCFLHTLIPIGPQILSHSAKCIRPVWTIRLMPFTAGRTGSRFRWTTGSF